MTAEDDSDVLPLFKISVSDYVKYFNVATSVASRDVKAGVNALGIINGYLLSKRR